MIPKQTEIHTGGTLRILNEKRLLITLWYLANEDSFREMANLFGVSESTVHKIVNEVVNVLAKVSPQFIKWPTQEQASFIEDGFFNKKKKMQHILGAIDGCHINIRKIGKSNLDYINRKSESSILLQGVVDNKKKFIDIHCGEPGSIHDARLLRKSKLHTKLMEDKTPMYGCYLLGDSAYPSLDWLVPPFKDNGRVTPTQKRFNKLHSSHRIVVEHGFGLLKGRWRRLYNFQNLNITFITKATIAAVVLHNICIDFRDLNTPSEYYISLDHQDIYLDPQDLRNNKRISNDRRQTVFNEIFGRG